MDREQFRKAGYAAVDRICDYFENIESYDVVPKVQPGDIAKLIGDEVPEKGEPWDDIAKDFDRVILPGITHWQHPNFYAYFPANTTFECILADMYVGAVSNPGFNWLCSPACTELESKVTDWVAKLLGLDQSWCNEGMVGAGVIQGSASESVITVCIAARERFLRLHPSTPFSDMVILGTTQTHSLGAKAALILGFEFVAIETRAEDEWALKGEALEKALRELEEVGKKPFILIATLGSTSTGAIDNIAEVTAVTAAHPSLFLHIDAAWGGVFLSLPECRDEAYLEAINARAKRGAEEGAICAGGEVHSFCTNLHKSGLVTFDASCLWIRDRTLLTTALDITPPFLRTAQASAGLVTDYRNMSLSLGRRFRSLKIWWTLRSYGVEGFRRHLRRLTELARVFEDEFVKSVEGVQLFTRRRFSLVVFRVVPLTSSSPTDSDSGKDEDKLDRANALTRTLTRLAASDHSLMLTATTVGGTECVRVAVGSGFTEERHVRELVGRLGELIGEARGGRVNGIGNA
ncbi:aromatic-L-amino-acid decarboxylase [Rhodotorula toruloides]|uniref:Aromatic-L-amino-acid decarboxylase n=1 Tax=Rhodotorula toruloides TaxID=5286 RepID=A0A511KGA2_RHOTO|nr:aromatic-L-amino-acid decarboxylase [Rhodotorula toruloides]